MTPHPPPAPARTIEEVRRYFEENMRVLRELQEEASKSDTKEFFDGAASILAWVIGYIDGDGAKEDPDDRA